MRAKLNQKGFSLVELMIASAILAALASSVILARSFVAKQTVRTIDRAFATQKAIQMFEELKSLVSGKETGISILDNYTDGSLYNFVLTTDKNVDVKAPLVPNPGDSLSGNFKSNGHWRYMRQVEVNHVANDSYTRQVFVTLWRYASDRDPNDPGEMLAQVGGQLRTISSLVPPTQVFDIYVLGINNIPAWWTQEPILYKTFQNIISDMQGRNPGLQIRPHFITRSSYGRDTQYVPYINNALSTDLAATSGGVLPYVYFYPGTTHEDNVAPDNGSLNQFFDPSSVGVQVTGNFNVDGAAYYTSGQFSGCPVYPAADKDNNSLRYPDELLMYQAVTQAAANSSQVIPAADSVTEISERMLIEGMLSQPASFENALIVNLHGELLPLPPMRNYSDAAKIPGTTPYERVVTHPELLYYPTGSTTTQVKLRVYAYYDGLDNPPPGGTLPAEGSEVPAISLFLPDVALASTDVTATAIIGSSASTYVYCPMNASAGTPVGGTVTNTDAGNAVSWCLQNPVPTAGVTQTLITLYNTRLRCPPGLHNTGLPAATYLYGTEYIPCSPEMTAINATTQFTAQDLTYSNATAAKNTARWIISLNMPVTSTYTAPATDGTLASGIYGQVATQFVGQHVIETRIGNAVTASSFPNLSRTYVWVGNGYPPPYTERYQFLGDPRHEPYLDCKVGGLTGGTAQMPASAYNWYFKDGNAGGTHVGLNNDGYTGYGAAGDIIGWEGAASSGGAAPGDANFVDLPRFYQMVRQGLLNTTAIWTTMNGYSYYYYGFGGEFGADQMPFSSGITMNTTPYNTTSQTALSTVAEIINYNSTLTNMRVISNTKDTWYEKSWLGELYPDSMYSVWSTNGNLPVANATASTSTFYRKLYSSVPVKDASGNTNSLNGFGRNLTSRAYTYGCTSFFDGSFNHQTNADSATLLSLGVTCYPLFEYPLAQSVSCTRSWALGTAQTTSEWSIAPYSTHTTLSIPKVSSDSVSRLFYDDTSSATYNGTGVVQLTSNNQVAYVVESGLAISPDVGTAELGKTALVFMLRTYLDGGTYTGNAHIAQMPLVELYCDSPNFQYNQPATINLVVDGAVTTGNPVTISGLNIIAGPTNNIWFRFPGLTSNTANFYTEEYPGYPNLSNSTYSETSGGNPVTLDLNFAYSNNAGVNWYFMQDNAKAIQGALDTSSGHLVSAHAFPVTFAWPVPSGTFPQGDYTLMVEAYREGFPLNYSYHQIIISINR